MKNVVAVCTESEVPMRIITYAILLATICQAQVEFVPTRPGNWTPTTPIFGVKNRVIGDSIQRRSIRNVGVAPIEFHAVSLEITSPGLEGEWWGGLSISGLTESVDIRTQRVQFRKIVGVSVTSLASNGVVSYASLSPNSMAELNVGGLTDCYRNDYLSCVVDRSVTPPDSLFKHNTANPVDTIDARLGVYWRLQGTDTYDSAYLDCQIEYRSKAYTVGVQYRGGSPVASRPVGVSGGWRVETGSWSLRRPDGAVVPLGRQETTQGLLLQPTLAFAGIGILHNDDGQAFRVVGVR
jgi:hypothetical protein